MSDEKLPLIWTNLATLVVTGVLLLLVMLCFDAGRFSEQRRWRPFVDRVEAVLDHDSPENRAILRMLVEEKKAERPEVYR